MSGRFFSTVTVIGCAAIPFIACGGDDGNKVDSGIIVHDSSGAGSGSGSGSGSGNLCAVMASYTPTFTSSNSVAIAAGSDLGSAIPQHDIFQGELGATQTDPFIDIEIVGGGGSANTPDWPGNLGAKSGMNLATTMDALAAIAANINGSGQAGDIYYATAGTLNITAAGNGSGSNSREHHGRDVHARRYRQRRLVHPGCRWLHQHHRERDLQRHAAGSAVQRQDDHPSSDALQALPVERSSPGAIARRSRSGLHLHACRRTGARWVRSLSARS